MNDKDDVIFRFEAGDDRPVAGFVSYRFLVDLRDDSALGEVDLISKRPRADAGDHDTGLKSGFGCDSWGYR